MRRAGGKHWSGKTPSKILGKAFLLPWMNVIESHSIDQRYCFYLRYVVNFYMFFGFYSMHDMIEFQVFLPTEVPWIAAKADQGKEVMWHAME